MPNLDQNTYQLIVIGEGAAGLLAAATAAQNGVKTLLLGKMATTGIKLTITGNGRCNFTNTAPLPEFINRFGKNGNFLRPALTAFSSSDLIAFFNSLGIESAVETEGCVFPKFKNAQSIVNALTDLNRKFGVEIKLNSPAKELLIENAHVTGVKTQTQTFLADNVIIATGGKSYPATGSTGDGYSLAAQAGHTIIPPQPALVPLVTTSSLTAKLQGISLSDIAVQLFADNKKVDQARGDMIFTHFGLSGPAIFSVSKFAVLALAENKPVTISLDLCPETETSILDKLLTELFHAKGKQTLSNLLKEFMPKNLSAALLESENINPETTGSQVKAEQRKIIRRLLKDLRFNITGHKGFNQAIVTAGGVSLKEIDSKTMQSKLVSGLYFAGEVLDLDGDCGGFNLQAAFSTAHLAAISLLSKTNS